MARLPSRPRRSWLASLAALGLLTLLACAEISDVIGDAALTTLSVENHRSESIRVSWVAREGGPAQSGEVVISAGNRESIVSALDSLTHTPSELLTELYVEGDLEGSPVLLVELVPVSDDPWVADDNNGEVQADYRLSIPLP